MKKNWALIIIFFGLLLNSLNAQVVVNDSTLATKDHIVFNTRADELMRLESDLTRNHEISVQRKDFEKQEQIKEGERLYQKKLKNFLFVITEAN